MFEQSTCIEHSCSFMNYHGFISICQRKDMETTCLSPIIEKLASKNSPHSIALGALILKSEIYEMCLTSGVFCKFVHVISCLKARKAQSTTLANLSIFFLLRNLRSSFVFLFCLKRYITAGLVSIETIRNRTLRFSLFSFSTFFKSSLSCSSFHNCREQF